MKVSGIVPCLMLKGVSRDCKTKEILELSTIIYRGDKFTYKNLTVVGNITICLPSIHKFTKKALSYACAEA